MSIKKELLGKLTERQLKEIAENKGIKLNLSQTQKKYYTGCYEKEKIVDLMNSKGDLTLREIEDYIKMHSNL